MSHYDLDLKIKLQQNLYLEEQRWLGCLLQLTVLRVLLQLNDLMTQATTYQSTTDASTKPIIRHHSRCADAVCKVIHSQYTQLRVKQASSPWNRTSTSKTHHPLVSAPPSCPISRTLPSAAPSHLPLSPPRILTQT